MSNLKARVRFLHLGQLDSIDSMLHRAIRSKRSAKKRIAGLTETSGNRSQRTQQSRSNASIKLPRTNADVYRGKVNNVDRYVWISQTGSSQSYLLFVLGAGYAFQNRLSTVPVTLTIDSNSGNVNAAPHYLTVVPVSP